MMKKLLIAAVTTFVLFSSTSALADFEKTFTLVGFCTWTTSPCGVYRGASGTWNFYYTAKIGTVVGSSVTVLFDNKGNSKKITNDSTGSTARVIKVESHKAR